MVYLTVFEHRIAGIPCQIAVITWDYNKWPGERPEWETTWDVLDRNGRQAAWLEDKVNCQEEDRIQEEIFNWMTNL